MVMSPVRPRQHSASDYAMDGLWLIRSDGGGTGVPQVTTEPMF
jgi:hypothetical protein